MEYLGGVSASYKHEAHSDKESRKSKAKMSNLDGVSASYQHEAHSHKESCESKTSVHVDANGLIG
ncbi:hypothetical protein Ciccas_014468, partial [Cichlidogyrus casuarinus]